MPTVKESRIALSSNFVYYSNLALYIIIDTETFKNSPIIKQKCRARRRETRHF